MRTAELGGIVGGVQLPLRAEEIAMVAANHPVRRTIGNKYMINSWLSNRLKRPLVGVVNHFVGSFLRSVVFKEVAFMEVGRASGFDRRILQQILMQGEEWRR